MFKRQFHIRDEFALHRLAKQLFRCQPVFLFEETQVELCLGKVGYDISNGTPRNDPRADVQSLAPAIESLEFQQLVRQFHDGVASFLRLDASVRGTTASRESTHSIALTRAHDIAVGTRCLQDQRALAILAHFLHDILAMTYVYLFIRDTQKAQLAIIVKAHRLQRLNGIDGHQNTALHIAYTWAIDDILLDSQWASSGGAWRIDGINMAEQKDVSTSRAAQHAE